MSLAVTVGGFKPSFSRRLAGFDRQEVLAFCSQVIHDYERTLHELEQTRHELQRARTETVEVGPALTTSQRVERILQSAERIADEIEGRATGDAARLLTEANAQAAEVVKAAEHRATQIVEEAMSRVSNFAKQVVTLQAHYAELRAAFELAADTAANALGEMASREQWVVEVEEPRVVPVPRRQAS